MLDPRDWKAIFEVYAREPTLALALAYQFAALKQFVQSGPKGLSDAITGLDQAIEHLYPHTDFQKSFANDLEKNFTSKDLIERTTPLSYPKHFRVSVY